MKNQLDSDATLFIRFFAKCALVLGLASTAWTTYFVIWYPINLQAAGLRIAFTLALAIGGLILLLMYPRKQHHPDSTSVRIDGLILFLSIPAMMALLFLMVFGGFSVDSLTIDRAKFAAVKARVDSMELQHVDAESVKADEQWREVFFLPEHYIDLWVARGQVTILEMDGNAIEPMARQGLFTHPKQRSTGKGGPHYIEHYKMNAAIDSERYAVGGIYPGWVLRESKSDVYFILPEHKRMRDALTLLLLTVSVSVYLMVRIAIGIKFQDRNWREFKSIVIHNESSSSRRR